MNALMLLRSGVVASAAIVLGAVAYAIVSSPSYSTENLGYRGLRRQAAIDEGGLWAQVEPIVRWFAARFKGLLPGDMKQHLTDRITRAGEYLGIDAEEFIGLCVLSVFGGVAFGMVFRLVLGMGPMLVVMCGVAGAFLPYVSLSGEVSRRQLQIVRGLPAVTDLLALAMGAGLDFPGALKSVIEKWSDPTDAVVEEFTRIRYELRIGRTRKEALQEFADRIPLDPVIQFCATVIQAEERGNPLADVLQVQANMARMQRSVRAEEAAAKAGVAMALPLFLVFICILIMVVAPMIFEMQKTF